jgi:hypothetical protein
LLLRDILLIIDHVQIVIGIQCSVKPSVPSSTFATSIHLLCVSHSKIFRETTIRFIDKDYIKVRFFYYLTSTSFYALLTNIYRLHMFVVE